MLEHGGNRTAAARRYGIAATDWLDLSTGISPWSWLDPQAPPPSRESWTRLPEEEDGLHAAARTCYGAPALPVAGSQAALQALPLLRAPGRVGLFHPSYAEHAERWRGAGHTLVTLPSGLQHPPLESLDVMVVVNPNNPDGRRYTRHTLLAWHERLQARGGWLVVDEAFVDAEPELSLADCSTRPGLVVLRSLGKFFGLAGARVGFVLCEARLQTHLREHLGPWALAGPSREIACRALQDRLWQRDQRRRLHAASQLLRALLQRAGLQPDGACALFQWVRSERAEQLQGALAAQGILVRRYRDPAGLRFGLPGPEADWQRLEAGLASVQVHCR